jgi:hypothetical protein
MSNEYMKQLNADFNCLDLPVCDWAPPTGARGAEDLNLLMARTYIRRSNYELSADIPELATELGRQAVQMLEIAQTNKKQAPLDTCCPSAEGKLHGSLVKVESLAKRSPIIVTDDQEKAVGVIKAWGELTFYGFADIPELNIMRGVFASYENRDQIGRPPQATHAWKLPVEALGVIVPNRLSTFAAPPEVRRSLIPYSEDKPFDKPLLNVQHEDLVQLAEQYLPKAQPLRTLAKAS